MYNENKICFIIYKTNNEAYERLVDTIMQVKIPKGFNADIVTVEGQKGTAAAYNEGMKNSDAKYKVYIDEKSVILNTDFLEALIKIFQFNSKIGVLGFSGTKVIPTDAVCINSLKRVGMAYVGDNVEKKVWGNIVCDFETVRAVDGYFLMTQYDLTWREDLFFKQGYYDVAQCLEFQNSGYDVAVIRQEEPAMYCGKDMNYTDEMGRKYFLDEYSKDLYPLVSIVIPACNNINYLKESVESILKQNYRNLEIFITDNSSNNYNDQLLKMYQGNNIKIKYEHNPEFTIEENWNRARSYNNPKAEYVNWMMDGEIFSPERISSMVNCYLMYTDVVLVSANQEFVNAHENIVYSSVDLNMLVTKTVKLDGVIMGAKMFENIENYIGEITRVLIKKTTLYDNDFGWSGNEGCYLMFDFPTYLNALEKGSLIHIVEPLTYSKLYNKQENVSLAVDIKKMICWALELEYEMKKKFFLKNSASIHMVILQWLCKASEVLKKSYVNQYLNLDVNNLQEIFTDIAKALLQQNNLRLSIHTQNAHIYKHCSCCNAIIDHYLPIPENFRNILKKYGVKPAKSEMVNMDAYTCENCGSADRERAYALWMKRELPSDKLIHILDIAPSPALSSFIRNNFPLADYKTCDLFMPNVDYKLNIMNMDIIPDGSIDFFICSHVLEHVEDDIKAMLELKRILTPDGRGILVVPIDLCQKEIDEDPNCNDIGERWRRFGQDDHLRKYSKTGYLQRLLSVGFKVKQYKKEYFGEKTMFQNSLLDTTNVYIVSK